MDAISKIKANLDVMKILEYYDAKRINVTGETIRCACPLHDGNNPTAFVINDEGLWFCHTTCQTGGDIFKFVQKKEGVEFPRAVQIVSNILGIDIKNMEIAERSAEWKKEIKSFITSVQKRRKPKQKAYEISVPTEPVKEYRDFLPDTLKAFNMQWVSYMEIKNEKENSYYIRDKYACPVYNDGIIVGCSYRSSDNSAIKWLHQPTGFRTRDYLYGIDFVSECSSVSIVEGIFDVWAYYEIGIPAVCTFGAHLTDEQLKILIKKGVENIVLSYDGDDAGRKATKKAIEKLKNKFTVDVVTFPEGEDASSISREELKQLYSERRRVL